MLLGRAGGNVLNAAELQLSLLCLRCCIIKGCNSCLHARTPGPHTLSGHTLCGAGRHVKSGNKRAACIAPSIPPPLKCCWEQRGAICSVPQMNKVVIINCVGYKETINSNA